MKSPFAFSGRLHKRGLCLVTVLCILTLVSYHFVDFSVVTQDTKIDYSETGFGINDYNVRELLHYPKYKYSLTENFQKHVGDWDAFVQKPQAEKCGQFFRFLEKEQPDWELPTLYQETYDKSCVLKGLFFRHAYDAVKKEKKRTGRPDFETITDQELEEINDYFNERVNVTYTQETRMADLMTVVRLYGNCYFGNEVSDPDPDIQGHWARRMTPFFHDQLPVFETPDGAILENHFPGARSYKPDDTLLQYYHENMKGKGIVISAATRYTKDITRLIRVLRALNNKLPIQIVYRGDLLSRSKKTLWAAAVASKEDFLSDRFTDQKLLHKVIPEIDLSDPEKFGSDYPIQHLTFVNIERPMKGQGKHVFSGYNNKLLALMFNSFEEVMLVDADAVPLEEPLSLFQSPEFQETGAYFFRDRLLRDSNDWIETNYFSKLMPHQHSTLDLGLGIKPVTDYTMDIPYMRGWRHTQEAGIVLFHRKKHYTANLILLPLALWGEPIKLSIWGDKEMYWMAMAMAGDEHYLWSKYDAASVGELTTDLFRKLYNALAALEVCLTHPGHMLSSGRILWINLGFSFCKKNGYSRDERRFPFSTFEDKEVLKDLYQAPLRVRDAVVPPGMPPLRPRGSPVDLTVEVNYKLELKNRKKDVDQIDDVEQIGEYEPQKGWVKSHCCTDYYYCAYSAIENYDNSGTIDNSGSVFSFGDEDRKRYDFLGKVWITWTHNFRTLEVTMPPLSDYPTYEGATPYTLDSLDSIQKLD